MDATILESCHSSWIFDTDRMRFRRILTDIEVADRPVTTEWRPYFHLQMDPQGESFTVYLNEERTRMIRSWRHTHDCAQCGRQVTTELSLDAIRKAISV
jgi:hypothetical protein